MVASLGGQCARCGTDEDLELDCIEPQGSAHHRLDTSSLVCFYTRQARRGNLQLLCSACHRQKSSVETRRWWDNWRRQGTLPGLEEEEPF
jgi:5-methylcytosine-specific restriction endonuclease McrA